MKLDTHVHTTHSGSATVFPFNHFMRESYNTPEGVYATAKKRGMDLVMITDHDQISGALALGDREDVLVGCEVTAEWPGIDLCVHINVFDITQAQHTEIQRLRGDVRHLMPYLQQQDIYSSLNHVASGINGPLTAAHLAAVLPWVNGLEVINGTRQPSQNRTAMCLAAATGKHTLGGGDSHTGRGIGLTWTEVPGATTRREFMTGLRAGRGIAGGAHAILLPEIPFETSAVADAVQARDALGWRHSIVVVAEGALPLGGQREVLEAAGAGRAERLGGIGA